MILYLDNKNEWICFKFEKKDWKDKQRVERFQADIKSKIPDQHWIAEPAVGKELLWKVEFSQAKLFGEILNKHYPWLYTNSILFT